MSWDELKAFADDPLVTIGAHTISHCNLAQQSEEVARQEITVSRARIEEKLQRPVSISPIPMATGTPRARANSRLPALPATRPRSRPGPA